MEGTHTVAWTQHGQQHQRDDLTDHERDHLLMRLQWERGVTDLSLTSDGRLVMSAHLADGNISATVPAGGVQ